MKEDIYSALKVAAGGKALTSAGGLSGAGVAAKAALAARRQRGIGWPRLMDVCNLEMVIGYILLKMAILCV